MLMLWTLKISLLIMILSMSRDLKLCFFNSQGCSNDKFDLLCRQIPDTFDLIIIAETWNSNAIVRQSHPFYLHSSIPRTQSRTHDSGGLMVLISPHLRQYITATYSSSHHIAFTINNTSFAAFYLPPTSVSLEDFKDTFNLAKQQCSPQVYLGDLNVRFGKLVGDECVIEPNRIKFLHQFRVENNLCYHSPSNCAPRRDHLYTTPNLSPSYLYLPHPTVRSDHDVMHVTFHNFFQLDSSPPPFIIPKFRRSLLTVEGNQALLCQFYNQVAPPKEFCRFWVSKNGQEKIVQMSEEERRELVEQIESIIMSCLEATLHQVLGTYPPPRRIQICLTHRQAHMPSELLNQLKNRCENLFNHEVKTKRLWRMRKASSVRKST